MVADSPLKNVVLPDFRNLGVMLRVALMAESMNLVTAMAAVSDLSETFSVMAGRSVYFEPSLLVILLALYVGSPRLRRLPYRFGYLAVLGIVVLTAILWSLLYVAIAEPSDAASWGRSGLMALMLGAGILFYFNWRYRVLSPAIVEARLMALQARIRPHFLFNSLNTVLGLLREDPKRSEAVLENLAELFRALLAESRTLVPLSKELELAKAYVDIEVMRLGDRLQVQWQTANAPMDALIPPLVLQPLVENAVYHGIERREGGGLLSVVVFEKDHALTLVVRNPCKVEDEGRPGNRMALSNIRERLALHFDAEAKMSSFRAGEDYVVQIRIPCKYGHTD